MVVGNRNRCMDTIKGIACLFVVFIHYNWSNDVSETIKAIGRFAVPYFFFVSGYHLPDRTGALESATIRRKLVHLLKMMAKAAIVYSIFCVFWNYSMDSSWNWMDFIRNEITWWSAVKIFLTCDPLVYAHFWYLIALVLCYLVIWGLGEKPGRTGYLILFVVLLCGYSLLAEFKNLVGWKNSFQISGTKNMVLSNLFVLRALPFVLYGICLRKYNIAERRKIPFALLLVLIILGCLLAMLEQKRYGIILMYTGNHLMVIAMALMSIWYPQRRLFVLEYVGNRLSMNVYLYHIAAGKLLDLLATKMHLWDSFYRSLRPVCALAVSLLTAQLLAMVVNLRKQKLKD